MVSDFKKFHKFSVVPVSVDRLEKQIKTPK